MWRLCAFWYQRRSDSGSVYPTSTRNDPRTVCVAGGTGDGSGEDWVGVGGGVDGMWYYALVFTILRDSVVAMVAIEC